MTVRNAMSRFVARSAARLSDQPLEHRVCSVPERGWKQRIVSAPPAYASVAGTILNKALLSALRKEPRCRAFLCGDRRLAIKEATRLWFPGALVVSTDLTTASDRLPLDFVKAIVDGIIAGWKGLPDIWAKALRALTGPQLLRYPWGQVLNSERGVLMGLGPTWSVLSLAHMCWVDYSASVVKARYYGFRSTSLAGDDLIACWPPRLFHCYNDVVHSCGGSFSKGKMYVHGNGGNFTEMTFWVSPGTSGPSICWATGIPLKGLVGTAPAKEGEAYESLCSIEGRDQKARRVLRALRPDAWGRLRASGVSPCVPRSLGGAGLPSIRGSPIRVRAPKWLRLAIGRYLYGSGDQFSPLGPPSWEVTKDPVSLAARRKAESSLVDGLKKRLLTVERKSDIKDPRRQPMGSVKEVVEKKVSVLSEASLFSLDPLPPSASGMAVPSRFARSTRAWARRVLKGGVPNRMAIREGRSSRTALLARVRQNRAVWAVYPRWGLSAPQPFRR